MNRLQWLAEAEIDRLERLFEQPSPAESKTSVVIQERLTALERVRTPGDTAGR
jgi:RIO-like serine/threonine protein kinase